MQIHPFEPIYDEHSRLCILGSFPSVRSREEGFYYAHPRNRFWKLLSYLYGEKLPISISEKKAFLLRNGIALWDVYQSCEIRGSSDSSIACAKLTDLSWLMRETGIQKVFLNGQKAYQAFTKAYPEKEAIYLPSTSAANASWSLERLIETWTILLE